MNFKRQKILTSSFDIGHSVFDIKPILALALPRAIRSYAHKALGAGPVSASIANAT
jgi:hypothetical protein